MDKDSRLLYFSFFNEIGIIAQLSRAAFESVLPDGLLVPHFSVLNHLVRVGEGQTPLALSRAFQVPKTTMTHTLAGLEKHGFVAMRPNPRDGRSKCVWLTEAGRTFRDDAIGRLEPYMSWFSGEFAPEEISQLTEQLQSIRIALDTHREDNP